MKTDRSLNFFCHLLILFIHQFQSISIIKKIIKIDHFKSKNQKNQLLHFISYYHILLFFQLSQRTVDFFSC